MSAPLVFPPSLVCAFHTGHKNEIAAELAASGIGAGIVPYHGIRDDGTCTCGDFNCPDAGKHPDTKLAPHGAASATQDPLRAAQYFSACPEHNIGFALGRHFAAGDWDPRNGANLDDLCGFPKRTMTARSGGGGAHRLVGIRPSWNLKGGYIGAGVELRTGSQAVVIENSRHRSGGVYEWDDLLSPIRMLPKTSVDRFRTTSHSRFRELSLVNVADIGEGWIEPYLPEMWRVRFALSHGKYRDHACFLLAGNWETLGYPSQSEAEYNLLLLVSDVTDDQDVWLAVLHYCGLGKRDRECNRREDGHGHKLMRPDYITSLFTSVASRRAELREIGDPNLDLARSIFGNVQPWDTTTTGPSPTPLPREGVLDAGKNRRGRPRGGKKRHAAKVATIHFLASADVQYDGNGYIRLPVMEASTAMDVSADTMCSAVKELRSAGIVEGSEPKAYRKQGSFSKDRYLRLRLSEADALSSIEKDQ